MIDYTCTCVGKTCPVSDNDSSVSECFVLQLFKYAAVFGLHMDNQGGLRRSRSHHQQSAKADTAGKPSIASELDRYPTEVLEAVLGILKARRQSQSEKA